MQKLLPHYVKKANAWCCTELLDKVAVKDKIKQSQKISWFSTEAEAQKFYNA
jgi:hypothetical protein